MDVSTHSDSAIDNRISHRRDHSTSSTITSPVTGHIPLADSSQQLIVDSSIGGSVGELGSETQRNHRQLYGASSTLRARISPGEWFAMFVLCFVNLINYMDRFTIAGKYRDILTIDRLTIGYYLYFFKFQIIFQTIPYFLYAVGLHFVFDLNSITTSLEHLKQVCF